MDYGSFDYTNKNVTKMVITIMLFINLCCYLESYFYVSSQPINTSKQRRKRQYTKQVNNNYMYKGIKSHLKTNITVKTIHR